MESYKLLELNEYIKRVIALNFREPLWIEAEIIQVKESRGNRYLELVQKDDNSEEIVAQASAALWFRNYSFIKKKNGELLDELLTDGTHVRFKCRVEFNERYGLKLIIEDIDPKFTYGQLELQKQAIIQRLISEDLLDRNKHLKLPAVIRQVAVISSSKSAGYQDFEKQLLNNPYNYGYKLTCFETAVQGQKVEIETCEAIHQISKSEKHFDVAVIVRGGGSRLDLSFYDNYEISKAIALSGVPFLIGIGHDIDKSIVDLVSHTSLKTPTAVADFLVEHTIEFENEVLELYDRIRQQAQQYLRLAELELNETNQRLNSLVRLRLQELNSKLVLSKSELYTGIERYLELKQILLESMAAQLDSLDPEQILKKGYAYLMHKGKQLKEVKMLSTGLKINIHMADGSVNAQIE